MQAGNFLIQMFRQNVYFIFVFGSIAPQLDLCEYLVGERVTHHEAGVTGSTTEVYQAAFCQQDDILAFYIVNIYLRLHGIFGMTVVIVQPGHIDLNVKMSDVTNDGLVFHGQEVFACDQITATGSGYYNVCFFHGIRHFLHFKTVHRSLQGADRIDFGNDHAATGTSQRSGRTFTYITVSAYNGYFTGQHHVGSATDRINQTFFTAVFVIELGFGHRIVHVDGRDWQGAFRHALIQTMYTGSGFFTQTANVLHQFWVFIEHDIGQITAIVQNHVERTILASEKQGLLDAPVGLFNGLAFPGINADAGSSDGRSGLVLCREDVTGAPFYLCAQGDEGFNQHSRLDGHVQTAGDAGAFQRLGSAEFFAKRHQTGHFSLCQTDFFATPVGQRYVFYFVG